MADGRVEYEIRGDDSNLDGDLEKSRKKVEQSTKKSSDDVVKIEEQKTNKIKSESDKTVENAEKAADNVANAWKDAGQDAEKAMSDISVKNVDVNINADTGKAESAIRNVSRDKSIDVDVTADASKAESEIKGLEGTADDVGKKIGDSLSGAFGNVGGVAKDAFAGAATSTVPVLGSVGALTAGLSGAAGAALGIGAAVVGVGAVAVNTAVDMDKAMNGFITSTGKGTEETERYQGVLEGIYANNYGESFDDIAGAMAQVTKNMGDLNDADLQTVTESAFALRDTFEYDINESTRAAKAMMDNFGVSGEDAMSLIAAGAQNGLDYSGELLDSISEYSVQFSKVGLGADDMFKIFQKGADTGAFNLDKVGDAVKEMAIRVVDGSETTKQGFEGIGLNADDMAAKFAAGGDSAKEAFNQTIQALASMDDPMAQNAAGVALFGTQWEDLGPEVVTQLASIQDGAYDTKDAMDGIKDVKYDDLGSMFEGLKRSVELLLLPLGEALIPILSKLIEAIMPIIEAVLPPLITLLDAIMPIISMVAELFAELIPPIAEVISAAIQPLMEALLPLISILIDVLKPVLEVILSVFGEVFSGIAEYVTDQLGLVMDILKNIIDFIKNVFTGNWKGAWENIKNIFGDIVSGLGNAFKLPLNLIISAINGFIKGINKIQIPDWVPGVGGKGLNIPTIPKLKVGMDYVPSDDFPALLHKGEAVLTAEEAQLWRSLGGNLQGVMASQAGSSPSNVVIQGKTLTKSDIFDAVKQGINASDYPRDSDIYLDARKVGYSTAKYGAEKNARTTKIENLIKTGGDVT